MIRTRSWLLEHLGQPLLRPLKLSNEAVAIRLPLSYPKEALIVESY